jgi:outer membrane protein assembly factor BamB
VELHAVTVDGRTRDVIIVTTDYGRTMALDASSGARLWQYQGRSYAQLAGSSQITTATPVIDPDLASVYVASPDGFIHKLAIRNGHQVWSTRITFDPTHEKIAGALNITGDSVVAVTGGYFGDAPPYQGHVVLIDRGSGRITAVWNSLCSDRRRLIDPPSSCPASDSAIFGRPGSIVEPDGDLLVATGNAPFNGRTNWGDSVLELSPSLKLRHNYTPVNQAYLNTNDVDLGSTSPALLDNRHGPPLAVMAGKDGLIKLLNLDRLDGTPGPAGPRTGGQLQEIPAPGTQNVFSQPAVWKSSSGQINVFYTTGSGTADYVLAANRRLHVRWQNGTSGTSPLIAGGLLYVYDFQGGKLDIYRPASGRLLDSLPAAPGHWNSPIVVGGRIILPEGNDNNHSTTGQLDIYHLPGR